MFGESIIIYIRIFPFIEHDISPFQHEFVIYKSTTSNFVEINQFISGELEKDRMMLSILIFQRLLIELTMRKLIQFGLTPDATTFILVLRSRKTAISIIKWMSTCSDRRDPFGSPSFLLLVNDSGAKLSC